MAPTDKPEPTLRVGDRIELVGEIKLPSHCPRIDWCNDGCADDGFCHRKIAAEARAAVDRIFAALYLERADPKEQT